MLEQPNGLGRRSLLKRTGAATTGLLAPSVTTASDHEYTFESHLPEDYSGPFATHYQFHFPDTANIEVEFELLAKRTEDMEYGFLAFYDDPYPGFEQRSSGRVEESYTCGPGAGECTRETLNRRGNDIFGGSTYFSMEVEEGVVLPWTFVSPLFTIDDGWPVVPYDYPFRFSLTSDRSFSVSVEAGTTLYPFDQHSFEGGAAAVTRTGEDTPLPDEASIDAEVMYDQSLTAAIDEEKARLGLYANNSFSPGPVPAGTKLLKLGQFAVDHPGGTERWTLADGRDHHSLLGDPGTYRLQLSKAALTLVTSSLASSPASRRSRTSGTPSTDHRSFGRPCQISF